MLVVFVTMVCASVAVPLVALTWALRGRQCPHCGAGIEPHPALVRMMTGE